MGAMQVIGTSAPAFFEAEVLEPQLSDFQSPIGDLASHADQSIRPLIPNAAVRLGRSVRDV